jgi:membrane protease subunit HflK
MSSGNGPDWPPRRRRAPADDPLELLREIGQRWRGFSPSISPWIILAVVFGLYLLTGIYIVAPDERGVVLRFGRAVRDTDSGPHYRMPWPLEQVIKVPVTRVNKEELGFRMISPGPPARFRQVDAEALMLTGDNNIVSLDFIVQYRVKSSAEGPKDFLFNVQDPAGAVRDAAEAAMREVIGASKIDDALTEGKERIQDDAQALLQAILDGYGAGIDVLAVKLQDVDPPGAVSDAFKDVISAEQDKERMINEARGYHNDIVPKARGEAAQWVNEALAFRETKVRQAEGVAQRFIDVYEEYTKARDVTSKRLYLETMEEILPRLETIILDESLAGQALPFLPLDTLTRKPAATEQGAARGDGG